MSRTISTPIEAQIAAAYAVPRTLINIYFAAGTVRRTSHTSNITFQGMTYSALGGKHDPIRQYLEDRTDRCKVSLDNVNQVLSGLLTYEDPQDVKVEIWKVFLNPTTLAVIDGFPATDDKIILFSGSIDEPEDDEQSASLPIVSIFDASQCYYPMRRFGTRCNNDYCDTRCGYNGGTKPRGTVVSATTTSVIAAVFIGISTQVGGQLKMLGGAMTGRLRYIKTHNTGTGEVTFDALPSAPVAGDTFLVDCDKSRASCAGFSNEAKFDGFDYLYITETRNTALDPSSQTNFAYIAHSRKDSAINNESRFVALVYGRARISGALIRGQSLNQAHTRVYGFCAGEISAIDSAIVNGKTASKASSAYQERLGTSGQSVQRTDFGVNAFWEFGTSEVLYWPWLALAVFRDYTPGTGATGTTQFYSGRSQNVFTLTPENDVVEAIVKGKLVQKYDASGNPDGAPVWSDNPVWCYLDYKLNESPRKLTTSLIDWATCYASAVVCDTKGYRLNIKIEEQVQEQGEDESITRKLLSPCRGYVTYPGGKLAVNVEQAWSGDPAFDFGDGYNGSARNIVDGKITRFRKSRSSDLPNRITVEYTDASIRSTGCQLTADITANQSVITGKNFYGSFSPVSGTAYIGNESFTYIGFDGENFGSCSARSQAYPKNTPIYQGTQLFPMRTAVWNDYDSQARRGRIVEKTIKAPGIPTYDQAYQIAEWHGEKINRGNLCCKFRGGMNSLKLTVGDVVSVTCSVYAWVEWLFRIIETSESEDEEVDYVCELYHDAMYSENSVVPLIPYLTLLESPWTTPPQVTGLVVTEEIYLGTDGTWLSRLIVTYTMPSSDIWAYGAVFIKIGAGSYLELTPDRSGGIEYIIDALVGHFVVGNSVTVKVVSVSKNEVRADFDTAPEELVVIQGQLAPPSDVTVFTAAALDDSVLLQWDHISDPDLWGYEIRIGASWAAGAVIASGISKNNLKWFPTQTGTLHFWIKALDTCTPPIESANAKEATLVINAPGAVTDLRVDVIDNFVQFRYGANPGTFPIDRYEFRKGDTFAAAEVIGQIKGTFFQTFEMLAGTYKYWVVAIDTAGLYGTEQSIVTAINQPPDFVLAQSWADDFTGTKTNIYYDSGDNKHYACVDTTTTWDDWCTAQGILDADPMQEFIDLGGVYMEPMLTTATYEKVFDYGTYVPGTIVVAELVRSFFQGSLTIAPTISVSFNGTDYTAHAGVWQLYASNFRYIKVHLDITGTATDILALDILNLSLNLKKKEDTGLFTITDAAAGKLIRFNVDFIDFLGLNPSARGSVAKFTTWDFTDSTSVVVAGSTTTVIKLATGEGAEWSDDDWVRVPLETGVEWVQVATGGVSGDDITVTPALSSAPIENTVLYHASFRVWLFDAAGTKVTGDGSWKAELVG